MIIFECLKTKNEILCTKNKYTKVYKNFFLE